MLSKENLRIINIKEKKETAAIKELLSLAIGYPTEEKVNSIFLNYQNDQDAYLFGIYKDNALLACLGFSINDRIALIQHIAVDPSYQKQGIGRYMINWLEKIPGLQYLIAETDQTSVNFYRHCGFKVNTLQGEYTRRFLCTLAKDSN